MKRLYCFPFWIIRSKATVNEYLSLYGRNVFTVFHIRVGLLGQVICVCLILQELLNFSKVVISVHIPANSFSTLKVLVFLILAILVNIS